MLDHTRRGLRPSMASSYTRPLNPLPQRLLRAPRLPSRVSQTPK